MLFLCHKYILLPHDLLREEIGINHVSLPEYSLKLFSVPLSLNCKKVFLGVDLLLPCFTQACVGFSPVLEDP